MKPAWIRAGMSGFLVLSFALAGQPKLILPEESSYQVGDRVPAEFTLLDENLQPVRPLSEVKEGTRVVVVVLFGGAAAQVPEGPFRGPLWCQDSFDDLAIQRALVNALADQPVEVIGVAVPPVYASGGKYGYPPEVFLTGPEDSTGYEGALRTFVEMTVRLRESSLLPYPKLYFDPRMTTLSMDGGQAAGNPSWLGRFKWHLDPRRYGAPTIWILNRSGEVLAEPFWGNEYGTSPSDVRYGFAELESAVLRILEAGS